MTDNYHYPLVQIFFTKFECSQVNGDSGEDPRFNQVTLRTNKKNFGRSQVQGASFPLTKLIP